jgi:hypothetical protein
MKISGKVGIYCLANDKVLEWMIAFLESVRSHEPECPIYIVPFDDNISQLRQISQKYNFDFYEDESLELLDEIGAQVRGINDLQNHRFRIFSIFWGPLDNFIFLDSDIVVLDSLKDLFDTYLNSDYEFMYYYRGIFDQVYRAGEFREQMIREYNANGFNAGSFLSSKGVFSIEDIKELATGAAQIRQHFAEHCIVQPFVNYCVDVKRLKTQAIAEAIPTLGSEWAKFDIELVGNTYQVNGQRILYTHWAGFNYGPAMPNRQLFLKYRLKSLSQISRYQYLISERLRVAFRYWKGVLGKKVKSWFRRPELKRT